MECSDDNLQLSQPAKVCQQMDSLPALPDEHPVCISLAGVSSSLHHMFKIIEIWNKVSWLNILSKINSGENRKPKAKKVA